jgi:hypothetical protein
MEAVSVLGGFLMTLFFVIMFIIFALGIYQAITSGSLGGILAALAAIYVSILLILVGLNPPPPP